MRRFTVAIAISLMVHVLVLVWAWPTRREPPSARPTLKLTLAASDRAPRSAPPAAASTTAPAAKREETLAPPDAPATEVSGTQAQSLAVTDNPATLAAERAPEDPAVPSASALRAQLIASLAKENSTSAFEQFQTPDCVPGISVVDKTECVALRSLEPPEPEYVSQFRSALRHLTAVAPSQADALDQVDQLLAEIETMQQREPADPVARARWRERQALLHDQIMRIDAELLSVNLLKLAAVAARAARGLRQ